MAGQCALRRWKPFFNTFAHVDVAIAIEAAGPALSRGEFRLLRGQIVEVLCNASDDGLAEELCLVLDEVMAQSLVSLESVPAAVVQRILASSDDLAEAIDSLRGHESERVRRLAGDIVRSWRASIEADFIRLHAAMGKMDALPPLLPSGNTASHVSDGRRDSVPSDRDAKMSRTSKIVENQPRPKKMAPVFIESGRVKAAEASHPLPKKTNPIDAGSQCVRTEKTKAWTKTPEPLPKKTPPSVCRVGRVVRSSPEEKMEATKRELHDGYQEAADAKRQRKIQVIQAPKMVE